MKFKNILLFLGLFIVISMVFKGCAGNPDIDAMLTGNSLGVATVNKEYKQDDLVSVKLRNNTEEKITITNDCPAEPLEVFRYINGEWQQLTVSPKITCDTKNDFIVEPKQDLTIKYTSWNHALFNEIGRYKIMVKATINGEAKEIESNEFTVSGKSTWGYIWGTFFYQPIYNLLIYFVSIIPGYNLGFAIIMLTLFLRLLLFIPQQRAMESQKKLQEIQPRIKKLQEQYKNNQQKLAQETFALYKEYKVNPFGSCLPLLIQLPILIALFYVIQNGLNPDNVYLLYQPLRMFDLSVIDTNFLGILNLTRIDAFALPLIVGGLQFVQMKLSMKKPEPKKELQKEGEKKGAGAEMEMAQKMMIYILPAMIALFTASTPSGVGLYWGVSTIFGIGQQLYVNKKKKRKKNEPEVKVITK
ncbi:membrane protein insertase YidC [Candidatus Peregrinibacteria bacterium]|nr:membrane protein insertase YidC [Candidatus Peregrinibacteria bacterium]